MTQLETESREEFNNIDSIEFVTLKELCNDLSISFETGKNWVKLGKLIPERIDNKMPIFTSQYVKKLKNEIKTGKNSALKSRRNKKYISGNALYNSYVSYNCKSINSVQKLLSLVEENSIELSSDIIQLFVADCALHLFAQKNGLSFKGQTHLLLRFIKKEISIGDSDKLIENLITDIEYGAQFCSSNSFLFDLEYSYESREDILGLLYLSCKNLRNRKETGAYYTPNNVVVRLIKSLDINDTCMVLDPCCGTGNFLIQLPDDVKLQNLYANDIDPISVKIARINIALKYDNADYDTICSHILVKNYLTDSCVEKYDYIIGNPPWGYVFSEDEKIDLLLKFSTAKGKNIESYDVFIEKALSNLKKDGILSFVLPEAILNVQAHMPIRKYILESNSISYIEYLGNAFDGVNCSSIIMSIRHTKEKMSTVGLYINDGKRKFRIDTERKVSADFFSFITTDDEYEIIRKIFEKKNNSFLHGNADFALGIVTGNNKDYISRQKNDDNEMVLKGSDICKYHIKPTDNYIVFKPESFQQVAPSEVYRADEKLLYRFICSQLVFAYDDRQTLSLNSCNVVIPHIEGLKIKYVMAVLNSGVAQFIFKKQFNSVKVLRSHIESIPIPSVDNNMQEKVIAVADKLISCDDLAEKEKLYEELDSIIFDIYGLSNEEIRIIKESLDGENKFLI